jgi:hypothetical protein
MIRHSYEFRCFNPEIILKVSLLHLPERKRRIEIHHKDIHEGTEFIVTVYGAEDINPGFLGHGGREFCHVIAAKASLDNWWEGSFADTIFEINMYLETKMIRQASINRFTLQLGGWDVSDKVIKKRFTISGYPGGIDISNMEAKGGE